MIEQPKNNESWSGSPATQAFIPLARLRELAEPTAQAWCRLYQIDDPATMRDLRGAIASYGEMLLQHHLPGAAADALRSLPPQLSERTLEALETYIEWHGAVHDENCPADDTCTCSSKWVNDGVNEAFRVLRKIHQHEAFRRKHRHSNTEDDD